MPERTEIEGFIARHAESKEEWIVQRFGNKLIRRVIKTTPSAEVYQRTIKTYVSGNKALGAFHAEKKRAKGKHFEILAFDSTTSKPIRKRRMKEVQRFSRKVRVLGRKVPLEDGD